MSDELFKAIEQHDVNRVAALLADGADPNAMHAKPPLWRPLEAAVEELNYGGSLEAVRLLLKHGADVNAWDGAHRVNPLLAAMVFNNKEAIRVLLEAGADASVVSDEGETPLRWAVEEGDLEMAALFLQYGANQMLDKYGGFCGFTPLGMAARRLDVPMIELLLDAGADPEALDEDEQTAREILPPRAKSDPEVWDTALDLLARRTA
jgi:ankyrin repeat protein